MNLTLREARKLETRIQGKINEGIVSNRSVNIHESFLTSEDEIESWLGEGFAMAEESISAIAGLISARATIRRDVQATNERVGINALVSDRKELISLRSVWNDAIQGFDKENGGAMTADVTMGLAVSAIESSKVTSNSRSAIYGTRNDTLSVSTISDELFDNATHKARILLRAIDKIEDKLAGLNATTKIELESTLVDFLEEQDLL